MTPPVRLLALLCGLLAQPASAQDMSAQEAFEATRAGKITLIDIRTPPEWKQTGVAQDAKLVNMIHPQGATGFLNEVLAKVGGDRTAPIALICRTGNRTTQVQKFLQAQGFTRVYNVTEGMAGSMAGPGWLARKLPVEACSIC
ncbi:MAG: rhodanese-like domain-containing protein [Rhodocyclaceae bacterium]|nr:rhodanese-like domain-containing protein [Rhodocyclaceae bacterium]